MLTLYQAEWCPYSHVVRERLTELGVDFVAKQVPADPPEREEMRAATGGAESIPTLVTEDGEVLDDWREILRRLDESYEERPDARRHRLKLIADADMRDPRSDDYPSR